MTSTATGPSLEDVEVGEEAWATPPVTGCASSSRRGKVRPCGPALPFASGARATVRTWSTRLRAAERGRRGQGVRRGDRLPPDHAPLIDHLGCRPTPHGGPGRAPGRAGRGRGRLTPGAPRGAHSGAPLSAPRGRRRARGDGVGPRPCGTQVTPAEQWSVAKVGHCRRTRCTRLKRAVRTGSPVAASAHLLCVTTKVMIVRWSAW